MTDLLKPADYRLLRYGQAGELRRTDGGLDVRTARHVQVRVKPLDPLVVAGLLRLSADGTYKVTEAGDAAVERYRAEVLGPLRKAPGPNAT